MNKLVSMFSLGFLVLLGSAIIGFIWSWPIQWLWNNILVGSINGINPVSFWQAYGIYILSIIMFRGNTHFTSKSTDII